MQTRPFPLARVADLSSPERGLSVGEVERRRERFGRNDVVEPAHHPGWALARDTAADPMLWFLVGTSALYGLIGDRLEAATLAAAIAPLTLMDVYLHRRTSASTARLRSRLAARARLQRDGNVVELPAAEVVPGDVALMGAGELVPADGVVLEGRGLQVDESSLSGESEPARKRAVSWPLAGGEEPPVAGEHWLFAGTRVLAGQGSVLVAYTGGETIYGEIVRSVAAGTTARTPLQRSIARLVGILTGAAVAACLVLAAVRLAQGFGWIDAAVSALTLAVAALPEEFPVVFTFFLGVGVYRLARRHALVRRAVAVENVGRITTICADKTGTMTEGRLVLAHLVPAAGFNEERLLVLAAQAARAESGDAMDVAILEAMRRSASASVSGPSAAVERVASFPFTEDRKRETAIVRSGVPTLIAVTKGAPETLVLMAGRDTEEGQAWMAQAEALAGGGHKVIACARRPLDPATWAGDEPADGFEIIGLLAFEDPVRPGVAEAVACCRRAAIRTIMVTGDHPATAVAVAREIGLGGPAPVVVTGEQVASGDVDALAAADVVARATPTQKLALVVALQRRGEIVAVTGDGVNDVPALKMADVGIAMGERGTQSAREVAPIVLLDDDFATIVGAIAEGRQLFHNLRQSFRYLLMIHIPLVVTAALVPLAGYPLVYLPIHIVALELIIHPTALLAFQAPAAGTALAPAVRQTRIRFFTARDWLGIAMVGALLTTLVAGGFLRSIDEGSPVMHARAVALVTLCVASASLAAVISGLATRAARRITLATLLGPLVAAQTPTVAARLHMMPLHRDDLAVAVVGGVLAAGLVAMLAWTPRGDGGDRRKVGMRRVLDA